MALSDWQEIKLDDVLESLIDYRGKSPTKSVFGIPVLSAKVISNGRIKHPVAQRVTRAYYLEWMRRGFPKTGDIILTTEGPLGEVAELDRDDYGLGQRIVCLRGKAGILSNKYLKFFLMSSIGQQELKSKATGTTVEGISQKDLRKIRIPLPPFSEQQAIGNILGALDDKIELNRRMNATLEAMARALFKSWFVDFDPVRAKMEGKQPFGMDSDTAALFPSRLVPSELGDIPEGWAVGTIKELCARVESGGTPSRSEPKYWQDGVVPWLTSGEVRQKIVMDTKEKISLKGLESSNAKLWPALSTVVAMYGATAGQVTLLGSQMAANQACCALIPSPYTQSFVYLKTSQSVSVYEGQATGSAQQNLNQTIVANLQTIIPIQNVLAAFENILVGHLFSMIQNTKESDSLAVMRDYLLPKLISGDIRIRDAEKFVEAA